MKIPSLNETLLRLTRGERIEERDFDMRLFNACEKLKKKFDIRYDPAHPVSTDQDMADRCFQAGRELYAEVGTYCVDSGRVERFSLDEMDAALEEAVDSVTFGQGEDSFDIRHRPVGSDVPVFVWGGIQTALYSDEKTMLRVYRACCRCREVDGIWGGIITKLETGEEIRGGTSMEIFPYVKSARILRQAAAEAGRPGMCVRTGAPTPFILAAQYAGENGLRSSDGLSSSGLTELKIRLSDLNRTAFGMSINSVLIAGNSALIGGFSGSIEGAAIVMAACTYQSRLLQRGQVICTLSTHAQKFNRSDPAMIWVNTLAYQALNRNTHLVLGGAYGDHPAAGPGTAQYLYETAAVVIPCVVSGAHPFGGTRKFNIGKTLDYGTPVENKFIGAVAKAAVGLDIEHAKRVGEKLVERYKDNLDDAPQGATLHELYDLENEKPKPQYRKLYDDVVSELNGMGVPMRKYEKQ